MGQSVEHLKHFNRIFKFIFAALPVLCTDIQMCTCTVIILKIRQTSFGKLNFLVEILEENCHAPV